MRKLVAAAVVALTLAMPALAADAVAPERVALAKQLIEVSGAAKLYGDPDKFVGIMMQQIKKAAPGIDQAALDELQKIATEEFKSSSPKFLDEAAVIYARHFTEADMQAMIAFYKTEAGQHLSAELPAVTAECADIMAGVNVRIMERFRAYLQQRASGTPAK